VALLAAPFALAAFRGLRFFAEGVLGRHSDALCAAKSVWPRAKKKKRGEKCQCGVVIENCSFEEEEGVRKKNSVAKGWVVCP
jgi:hypothetical protein